MPRTWRRFGAVLLLAATAAARADDPKPPADPPKKDDAKEEAKSPADQFKALQKEIGDARVAFNKAYREAKTDEERQKAFRETYPRPERFAPRFLKLAKDHPKDPAAIDALVWLCQNTQGGAESKEAIDILLRDHIKSEKLAAVCVRLGGPDADRSLRTILRDSPHKDVQGSACYALARSLKDRGGDEAKEAEALFERAEKDFADVKVFGRKLGDLAKRNLFEIRNLLVGKSAPEVTGEDVDGVKFKLSDYRGKVVLLDFWGHW